MAIVLSHSASTPSRRGLLFKGAMIAGGVMAAASLPASAAVKKMTQSAASYQPTPKGGAHCDGCGLFQKPASCQTVEGVISPSGWCVLFAAK